MAERHQARLPEGRRIDYAEYGSPDGCPALYLHGTPSSGSEGRWLDRPARARGVRLVAPDRPGYLASEVSPGNSPIAVAEDVVALAQALQLGRFAVIGFSGGAGYALVTAHLTPDAVTVVHLGGAMCSVGGGAVSNLAWWRRLIFAVALRAPAFSRLVLSRMLAHAGKKLEGRLAVPSEALLELLEGAARGAQSTAVRDYVDQSSADELRGEVVDFIAATKATRAVVADMAAVAMPWSFDPRELDTPVEIWHGRDDPAVPVAYAEATASQLRNARTHLFDGEGHFVFHAHGEEIIASIRRHAGA